MTTGPAPAAVVALLEAARDSTTSAALREVLGVVLASGAASLFEARAFEPEEVLFPFDAPRELWVTARGQAYVERRSTQGRGLRPLCVEPGSLLGTIPGQAERPWPPACEAYARGITAVQVAVLPEARFGALLAACPGIERALAFLDLRGRVAEVVDLHLRAFPGLAHLSSETLGNLFARAERVDIAAGDVLHRQGEVPDRFYVVLEGTVTLTRAVPDCAPTEQRAGAGHLVGAASALAQVPALETAVADGPGLCAAVPFQTFRSMLTAHPMARRGVETLLPRDTFDLVLLQTDVIGTPLGELTTLLARALREDFGDRTAILHLTRPGAPAPPPHDAHGTPLLCVRAATPDAVPAAIRDVLRAEAADGQAPDVYFLHPGEPALLAAAAPALSRVAWLTTTADSVPGGAFRGTRLDRAALLPPVGERLAPPWPTGTARLRLDFETVRRRAADARPLAEGPGADDPTVQGVRRWGRALTERLVGLALGGGGSPGFAHVALIRALETRARLPIDLVAGTSFGALVGAWYAGVVQLRKEEPARLQSLLDAGRKLNVCLTVGMLDTDPLARLVDRQLGGLRLGELERPFLPVSAEIDSGTVYVGRGTTLGRAVQMSGAFPPFFPPVIRGPRTRLVDGGFVNNVPASVLRTEGASFVIASNSIGLVPPRAVHTSRTRRMLAALNPVGRVEDAMRAGLLLFHRIGDAQALFADVSYEAAYTGFQFWDFNRGQEVIDQVQASADLFADRVAIGLRAGRKMGNVRAFGAMA